LESSLEAKQQQLQDLKSENSSTESQTCIVKENVTTLNQEDQNLHDQITLLLGKNEKLRIELEDRKQGIEIDLKPSFGEKAAGGGKQKDYPRACTEVL
jgi:hypothetical protein